MDTASSDWPLVTSTISLDFHLEFTAACYPAVSSSGHGLFRVAAVSPLILLPIPSQIRYRLLGSDEFEWPLVFFRDFVPDSISNSSLQVACLSGYRF